MSRLHVFFINCVLLLIVYVYSEEFLEEEYLRGGSTQSTTPTTPRTATRATKATPGTPRVLRGNRAGCSAAREQDKLNRCDYEFFEVPNAWYKMHEIPANWHEARLRCHYEGAALAAPTCRKKMEAMYHIMGRYELKHVWSGYHSRFSKEDYYTVEGIPITENLRIWAEREPDNFENKESCLLMRNDGDLADAVCSEVLPYICYMKNENVRKMNEDCGTTDHEYQLDSRTGSCYKFYRNGRTWSRAFMKCTADGGYLAVINSVSEATVLQQLFAKNPPDRMTGLYSTEAAYIGFHDWHEPGQWRTVHGDTLWDTGYSTFSGGEPNNATAGGESCGAVHRSGMLNDLSCERRHAFICEKPPKSLECMRCDIRPH